MKNVPVTEECHRDMKKTLLDSDIRDPLFDFLEDSFGKIRVFEEKNMGRSRADMVMVTKSLIFGIEIKSDADSYSRLGRQVLDYDRYFDRNIIVIGSSHAWHVREHVPGHWGIITVELIDGRVDFYVMREAAKNPDLDVKRKISILWRPELNRLLELNGLPGYRQKSKSFVQEKLLESVPEEILWPQVMEELFQRDYTTIGDEIREYKIKKGCFIM
jgi:hypothetical protein